MGNYIDDASKRLEEERLIIRAKKQKEQMEIKKKDKAEQLHKDHEKHKNSLLW